MVRPTPFEAVRSLLERRLQGSPERLPRRWELLGDVLVLRGVSRAFGDEASRVAQAYAQVLGARVVLEDTKGVTGARREPTMKRLFGEGPTETSFKQDGIRYSLDAARLMFSSGNLSERQHMGRLDATGETVVDLFAGIGYFTLPLLVHAGVQRAVACEINPLAARYLRQNAQDNEVTDRIEIREGDCAQVAPEGIAHRVVSGWFPHGHTHLGTALRALHKDGGMLHYHDTAHAERPRGPVDHLTEACARAGRSLHRLDVRVVKNYAPGVVHVVVDARVGPQQAPRPARNTPRKAIAARPVGTGEGREA